MKRKSLCPKRKRMTRQQRLNSGKAWILNFKGKNIISGYSKWFGVDKICGIKELKMLGIQIPEEKEKQILESLKNRIEQRRIRKEKYLELESSSSFIIGYTSGGLPIECTFEDMEDGLTYSEFNDDNDNDDKEEEDDLPF